ncbi:unnamed protein product, partial [Rotaria sp. Silwood1]
MNTEIALMASALSSTTITEKPRELEKHSQFLFNFATALLFLKVQPTSIFTSKEYLTMFLGYCDHCLKVLASGKDRIIGCDQCPNDFCVCDQCISLMPHQHPSMHTFSNRMSQKERLQRAHDLEHLGIICNNCRGEKFYGIRYHCERCEPSYDLCEKCINTVHKDHTFKIIPNPFLRAHNLSILARRTLDVIARKNNIHDHTWRDPITGWTKLDAENMVKQSQKEQDEYNTQLENIQNHELAEAKRRLEQQR